MVFILEMLVEEPFIGHCGFSLKFFNRLFNVVHEVEKFVQYSSFHNETKWLLERNLLFFYYQLGKSESLKQKTQQVTSKKMSLSAVDLKDMQQFDVSL